MDDMDDKKTKAKVLGFTKLLLGLITESFVLTFLIPLYASQVDSSLFILGVGALVAGVFLIMDGVITIMKN